jgi:hypothetical protein
VIATEKPGTPEELVHYGVKGMKWGVRRNRGNRPLSPTKQFKKDFPTARERRAEILRARASVKKADVDFEFAPNRQARIDAANAYLKNPDRATARRLTRGEKVVVALLTPAVPVLAPAVGANVLIRKRIEKKTRQA